MVAPPYFSQCLVLLLELVLMINGIYGLDIKNVRATDTNTSVENIGEFISLIKQDLQLNQTLLKSTTLYITDEEGSGDSKLQQNTTSEPQKNQIAFIGTNEAIKKWNANETSPIMGISEDENGVQLNQTESIIIACRIGGSMSIWAYALFALIIFLLIACGVYCFCPFCCAQRQLIKEQSQEYSKVAVKIPAESNRLTTKTLSVITEDDDV